MTVVWDNNPTTVVVTDTGGLVTVPVSQTLVTSGALPGPLKKAIGDKLSYVEEATFSKTKRIYEFKVIPSAFPEKTKVWGNLFCEKWNGKSFTRVSKINVEVKVFGIGGLVEDRIMDDLRRSYDAGEKFTNDFATAGGFSTR